MSNLVAVLHAEDLEELIVYKLHLYHDDQLQEVMPIDIELEKMSLKYFLNCVCYFVLKSFYIC